MECPAQVADLEVRDDTALTPALVRANLNKASLTKLYVDGEKITEHELHEAFDALLDAPHHHTTTPTHFPPDQPTAKSVGALTDSAADNRDNSTASNPPTLPVDSGWVTHRNIIHGHWTQTAELTGNARRKSIGQNFRHMR